MPMPESLNTSGMTGCKSYRKVWVNKIYTFSSTEIAWTCSQRSHLRLQNGLWWSWWFPTWSIRYDLYPTFSVLFADGKNNTTDMWLETNSGSSIDLSNTLKSQSIDWEFWTGTHKFLKSKIAYLLCNRCAILSTGKPLELFPVQIFLFLFNLLEQKSFQITLRSVKDYFLRCHRYSWYKIIFKNIFTVKSC